MPKEYCIVKKHGDNEFWKQVRNSSEITSSFRINDNVYSEPVKKIFDSFSDIDKNNTNKNNQHKYTSALTPLELSELPYRRQQRPFIPSNNIINNIINDKNDKNINKPINVRTSRSIERCILKNEIYSSENCNNLNINQLNEKVNMLLKVNKALACYAAKQ